MKTKKIVIHRDVNHKKGYLYLPQRNRTILLNPSNLPIWKRCIFLRTLTPWNHVKRSLQLLALSAVALFNPTDNPYSIPYKEFYKYKPKPTPPNKRKLQTFLIKGQYIQAYNKKDALKRYQHQNKKK